MTGFTRNLIAVGLASLLYAAVGCDGEAKMASAKKPAVDRKFERGPMTVRIQLDRNSISLAERLRLRVITEIGEGYTLDEPHIGKQIQGWTIHDYKTLPPALGDENVTIRTKDYILEPFLSGRYEIPSFKFTFRKPGEETPHEISTEAIEVEVLSILADQRGKLDVAPIKSVVSLPPSGRAWLWVTLGILALVAFGSWAVVQFRRGRKKAEVVRRMTAHEIAYNRLQALVDYHLVEQGELKEFYGQVSWILRQYLEDRFSLHAPERTTEEFLREAKKSDALNAGHAQTLGTFLGHCDQVKFARFEPSEEQIQSTFDTVKDFIENTRIQEQQVELPAAA